MYNAGQIRAWSLPHLKTGCWYIDCGKGFCPEEEEAVKASIDAKEPPPGSLPTDDQADIGDEEEANLANLSAKDRKKEEARIEREKNKKEKEDKKGKGKGKGTNEKDGRKTTASSKKENVVALSEETQSAGEGSLGNQRAAMSTGSLKRDAEFAGLSMSRMQLDISGNLKDCVRDSLNVDEFFFRGSFLSVEDHFKKVGEFSKEWLELKAFIEKVCLSPNSVTPLSFHYDSINPAFKITSIWFAYAHSCF